MTEERGELQDKIDCLVTQLRKIVSSTTGFSASEMMFGRDIITRLNVLADRSGIRHRIVGGIQINQFNVGRRVQARNYYEKDKWTTGKVLSRKGNVTYEVQMEHGQT